MTILATTGLFAQTDTTTTGTKTKTTTITETETPATTTQPATPVAEPAPAVTAVPQETSEPEDRVARKVYLGARFLPTFTNFKVRTINDEAAQTSFVVGYGIGGLLGFNMSKNAGLQIEAIYSTLSQKYTDNNLERTIDLSYIHFPLLLVLNTDVTKPVNLNIAVGPQFGINTGSSVDTDGSGGADTVQAVIAVKPGDFGIAYGAGLDFLLNPSLTLDIGFRGVYGILDISDSDAVSTTNQHYILDRSHVKTYAGYVGLKLLF